MKKYNVTAYINAPNVIKKKVKANSEEEAKEMVEDQLIHDGELIFNYISPNVKFFADEVQSSLEASVTPKINLLSSSTLQQMLIRKTKSTIFASKIRDEKAGQLNGENCVLFNLDDYPNKVDKVFFRTYINSKKYSNNGRIFTLNIESFDNDNTPMKFGDITDKNIVDQVNLTFQHKKEENEVVEIENDGKGEVQKLISKFNNAFYSKDWFLQMPLGWRFKGHGRLGIRKSYHIEDRTLMRRLYDDDNNQQPFFANAEQAKEHIRKRYNSFRSI